MFTGIVAEVGEVRRVEDTDGGRRLTIAADDVLSDVEDGASIAVNGACLTVEEFDESSFEVFWRPKRSKRRISARSRRVMSSTSNVRFGPTLASTVTSYRGTSIRRPKSWT